MSIYVNPSSQSSPDGLPQGWRLTGSVAWPQGRMAWKADTRRQKDLAARQGVDVGS